jgi:predicted HicB family RNase H-like nuclease
MGEKDKVTRMSIDINTKDHKKLKIRAAKERVSIREFVIDCIQDKILPQTGKVGPRKD